MNRNPHFAVTIDPAEVGAKMATLSSTEQAILFEAFAKELRLGCGSEYSAGMQMRFIQGHLSTQAQAIFTHLVPGD